MLTTLPHLFFSMCFMHSLVMINAPLALMPLIKSYLLVGVSIMFCHHNALALFTNTSTLPKCFTVSSTALTHASADRKSTTTGNARTFGYFDSISEQTV